MGAFSLWHWIILLLVVVMVFGTKKLKNLGSDLGSAIKGFKDAMEDDKNKNDDPQQLTNDQPGATVEVKAEKVDEKS
mgnify:CR=1 FL=1|jgi:twin arginine-targeting protein translocase, TatA/E family